MYGLAAFGPACVRLFSAIVTALIILVFTLAVPLALFVARIHGLSRGARR